MNDHSAWRLSLFFYVLVRLFLFLVALSRKESFAQRAPGAVKRQREGLHGGLRDQTENTEQET